MAIDWGGIGEDLWEASLPGIAQRYFAPRGMPVPALPPRGGGGVVTGTICPPGYGKRRRRRRRLLTPTDLNDLAALKTITGGGQALNFAVMKAVRK